MQKELKLRAISAMIKTVVFAIISLEIIYAISLVVGTSLLNKKASDLALDADRAALLLRSQGQSTVSDRIKELNSQISVLQNLQKRYVSWSPLISKFTSMTPSGIKLSSLIFDQKTSTLNFIGQAETRDAYIQYEKILQQSDLVSDVVFPLQTKKSDISFSISVNLKNLPKL
jgi:hypothetical protein